MIRRQVMENINGHKSPIFNQKVSPMVKINGINKYVLNTQFN
jgi:hypothetical protein